ncbi:MAG: amino acid adenylation domain-containing protein, partial [Ferruginibacter sp.]
ALLAAFKVLLYRYSGQEDICVGTSIADRQQHEVEGLIGFFINALALRTEVNGNDSFEKVLQKVRTTTVEAYEHQDVPFEKVVDAVVKERDMERSPLFQIVFALQNIFEAPELTFGGIQLSREGLAQETAKYDMVCNVTETPRGLHGLIQYATNKYTPEIIEQLIAHYKELLNSIVTSPAQQVSDLSILNQEEKHQLLIAFNDTTFIYPENKSIVDLFEEQVVKTPLATALVFEGEQLTYNELNKRANQLAHYLRSKGVKRDTLVPICMERSTELIVGILGILKAGGAFVPLDPEYPEDRLMFMLEDTNASIAISKKNSKKKIQAKIDLDIIELDTDSQIISNYPVENIQPAAEPGQIAYVIYTSGSTGLPKGVMILHKSNVNMSLDQVRQFGVTGKDKVLQFASISFDASVYEIFMAFYAGATLVLMDKEKIKDTENFVANLIQTGVSIVTLPPVFLSALKLDDLKFLRVIITAGEAADVKQAAYLSQYVDYYNAYGPTECAVCVSVYKVSPTDKTKNRIPIGKPLANTKIYILDENQQLAPLGVTGQLHVSGVGLAKGYLGRDELTAEKFITNPFIKGERLYKTGDIGRWSADGNIEFLGRKDDQIKIRGHRVELGEIENALLLNKDIEQCVVVLKEEKQDKKLVAYYQQMNKIELWQGSENGETKNAERINKDDLREFLKAKLPDYMIPSLFIELEQFPVTISGKIDRKALPDADAAEILADQYQAPRTEIEKAIALMWQEVLELDRVGIYDDFFELGGHSLLAIRLVSAIRKELSVELPISYIFDSPNIAMLAQVVQERSQAPVLNTIKAAATRPAHIPLSFSQERLWFIDRLEGSVQYHLPSVLRLKGNLNKDALGFAFQNIVNRHEILRTVFPEVNGQAFQSVCGQDGWQMELVDGSNYQDTKKLQLYIHQLITKPFDLAKDHMVRATLIKLDEQDHVLVVIMHHIASDAWSISLLVKEVVELYSAYEEKRPSSLVPVNLQYADYAIWQRNYLQGEVLDKKLNYWKNKLDSVEPLQLPTDYPRPAVQSSRGAWA